jgi:hypothetical protein
MPRHLGRLPPRADPASIARDRLLLRPRRPFSSRGRPIQLVAFRGPACFIFALLNLKTESGTGQTPSAKEKTASLTVRA